MALVDIRDQLLRKMPELGFGLTVSATNGALTATTTEQEVMRGGTNADESRYRNFYLFIPSANAANQSRVINSLAVTSTQATFTMYGPVYSQAGLTSVAAYVLAIDPAELLSIMNDSLDNEYFETTLPLSTVTDGDMQTSGVANWTDSSATSSKVTAAANVPLGLVRALRVANSGADGFTRSALMRITRAQPMHVWALTRADVGTATLTVVNAPVSDRVIDTITSTQEDWVYFWKRISPLSTDEEIYFRLGGSGASDDTYWGACGYVPAGALNIDLPSWCTKHAHLKAVSYATFGQAGDESNVYPVSSMQLHRLDEDMGNGGDFRFIEEPFGAHPRRLEFKRDWSSYPLWVTGLRKYSDIDSFSSTNEAGTTSCPEERVVARLMHLLALAYKDEFGGYYQQALVDMDALRDQQVQGVAEDRPQVVRGFARGRW